MGGDPFAGDSGGGQRNVRLRVQNDNFYDATISAITDTGRRRLGTVGGNQTAVFTMPWSFAGGLRVQIDLLAGPTCTTDPVPVNPGETIDLRIPASFDRYCR